MTIRVPRQAGADCNTEIGVQVGRPDADPVNVKVPARPFGEIAARQPEMPAR